MTDNTLTAEASATETESGWAPVMRDLAELGNEAGMVLSLRCARLLGMDAGAREELNLMVGEKVQAHGEWLRALATGSLGRNCRDITAGTVRHYLPWVRANRERLSNLVE